MPARFVVFVLSLLAIVACAPAAPPPPTAAPAPATAAKPQLPTTGKLAEIKQRGTANLYMEAKFKPYEFVDQNGQIVGIDVDIARKIFEDEQGIKVQITDVDFPGLITSLVQGKADMIISAIGATQERMKAVDFTIPYSPAGSVLVLKGNDTAINSFDDLNGKIVGSQTGSTPEKNAQSLEAQLKSQGKSGFKELRSYVDFPTVYEDLRVGRLDAAVAGYSTTSLLMYERPGEFKVLTKDGSPLPVGPPSYFSIAVPKGDSAFVEYLNARIRAYKADGSLASIHQKWYGESRNPSEFTNLPDPWVPPQ